MNSVIQWIMEGPAWIRYRCLIDLLGVSENDNRVVKVREEMISDTQIQQLLSAINGLATAVLSRHNDSIYPLHILCFLADLGFNYHDDAIDSIIRPVLDHQSEEGPFHTLSN